MLALAFTVLASAMIALLLCSLGYAIIAMLYGGADGRDLDDVIAEAINKYTVDDEIAAATAALIKSVTPTGVIAELAASMEAKRVHERSKA